MEEDGEKVGMPDGWGGIYSGRGQGHDVTTFGPTFDSMSADLPQ